MKRKVIPLLTLILCGSAMAQVGIGTKRAASSAQLEIVAERKGVLIPRVKLEALTSFNPIEGEQVESLLVYHIGENNLEAGFYYWRNNTWIPLLSGDTITDRMNNTFTIGANPTKNNEESLIITDSENHSVYLAIAEIANNETFITNLVDNQSFITKLGDNIEFINQITNNNEFVEQIINNLKGKYGNVNYNPTTNTFVFYDEQGVEHEIDWSSLNTTNVSFTLVNDFLVVTDSAGNAVRLAVAEIANNETFITNLVENQEFITKLGDNIEFINQITNNNEFIEQIINNLKGKYGNVNYNPTTNTFVYYDEQGVEHEIDWSSINTTNISFTLVNDFLVVTDSAGNAVRLAVAEIANNETFITNLVENQEFITKLGDNIDFINHITNNNEFIEQIINNLKGKYGNVNYNATTNKFVYYDEQGVEHEIDWSSNNTTNVSFTLDQDFLVVTDSAGNAVRLAVEEIAKNSTFVTNLVENEEFITKLGDNIDFIKHITENNEFITNIIEELKGTYGNVGYDTTNNNFFYYDENKQPVVISWDVLGNTKIKSFEVDEVNDVLVITDTENTRFTVAIDDLGKIIANNDVFVTELVENQEFITKLGDNIDFINHITNNNEFIDQIINNLKGKYGNVNYNATTNKFVYYDEQGVEHEIDWSSNNTTNVSFTLDQDFLVVTDSAGNAVRLAVEEIAKNSKFVTNLVENQEFIAKLGDNIDFIKHITENNEFITNIIEELKGTYGNVGYDTANNNFFYYDENKQPVIISWDVLGNTKIKSFEVDEVNDVLVITDTENTRFTVAIDDLGKIIANNDVFVTNLVENQEFITKLGDNIDFINQITNNNEFITNIIEELKGTYGNVGYDTINNNFFYYDENKQPVVISWDVLGNTKIKSFEVDEVNDVLVITDTENTRFTVAIDDLGKIIANNDVFVTNLVENQEFITKLGDNIDFINQITNNNEFITNIIEELKGTYGNVGYDTINNNFFYYDENKQPVVISWDVLGNTKIKSFEVDEVNDVLVITDTENTRFTVAIDDLGKIIANNDVFVTELVNNQEFISKLGNKTEFIDEITNNNEFITNIINKLENTYGNVGYDTVNNSFFYYDDQNNKQTIDLGAAVKMYETLTTLENVVTTETDEHGQEFDLYTLTYKDEKGDSHPIDINVLVKGSETLTTLTYDPIEHVLTYVDEQGTKSLFKLTDLVGDAESLTKLEFDPATNSLLYTDENQIIHTLELESINKHPWYDTTTQKVATTNTANIYTKGWVGIGFTEPSDAPSEKLRVNGSISAVNSYYADYVFENYFDGYSSLKYDYDFKSLDAVEDYIKENRHLPGITPIHELTKLDGGYAINISELSIQLLEKTEELYLHIIDQKNELEEKEVKIKQLEESNQKLHEQTAQQNQEMLHKIEQLEQMILDLMQKN
ncbi:hypothetical protein [Myroides odoratus]|uniref:hypothetical protein n=1 Tax=Myroides odoratus TaxID=256 RepID=UPI0007661430|nr:hypothetical protein [Myroides odoratus]